jgi:hypothetical protein
MHILRREKNEEFNHSVLGIREHRLGVMSRENSLLM